MSDPRPIAQLYAEGEVTGKAAIRAYHDARLRVRLVDADELRAGDFSLVAGVEIDARAWDRVVGDTTSLDDGQWILVDAVGSRFARATEEFVDLPALAEAPDTPAAGRARLYIEGGDLKLKLDDGSVFVATLTPEA